MKWSFNLIVQMLFCLEIVFKMLWKERIDAKGGTMDQDSDINIYIGGSRYSIHFSDSVTLV